MTLTTHSDMTPSERKAVLSEAIETHAAENDLPIEQVNADFTNDGHVRVTVVDGPAAADAYYTWEIDDADGDVSVWID